MCRTNEVAQAGRSLPSHLRVLEVLRERHEPRRSSVHELSSTNSSYWVPNRESAQDADRVLCAALKAGCNLGELVSEVVVNGKVELARVEMVNRDFAATKAKLCYCEVGCGGAALRLGINAEGHLRSRRPLLDGLTLPLLDASGPHEAL